jgi:G3E family GTPase
LAFQIRQLEQDTSRDFTLDAIVTVVDAENFTGYEDTSPTAKMQASYSDIIVIVRNLVFIRLELTCVQNKWEHVSERALDIVMDHLHTLNDQTPKIKCQGRNGVDPELIFGLQSKLFLSKNKEWEAIHDEVETVTLGAQGIIDHHHHYPSGVKGEAMEKDRLIEALGVLSRDSIWRCKGFVKLDDEKWHIVNWAFGRYELKKYEGDAPTAGNMLLTVMGGRGEVRRGCAKFVAVLCC